MPTDPTTKQKLTRLRILILNRRKMAERWHGLTEWWQIVAFAVDDPEVRALFGDPNVKRDLDRALMAKLSDADAERLRKVSELDLDEELFAKLS